MVRVSAAVICDTFPRFIGRMIDEAVLRSARRILGTG